MTVTQEDRPPGKPPERTSRIRIALWFVLVSSVTLGVWWLGSTDGGISHTPAIGWSLLIALPFSIGALTELLLNPANRAWRTIYGVAATVAVILGFGAMLLREGVICVVMLWPLWTIGAYVGALAVEYARKAFGGPDRTNAVVVLALPFLALLADANIPQPLNEFTVSRSVVIDAAVAKVWPLLLRLDGLSRDEGVWNITHNVLGVPRPSSAVVIGEGAGSVRQARWGADIRFEERITAWSANEALAWDFAFPDDSISRYTDRHLYPDGEYLKIERGSYRMDPLPDGRTRLILDTQYLARSPVNLYAALWGELVLGDIQTNILAVVKGRAEH